MNAAIERLEQQDYYVADIGQAAFGRKEIAMLFPLVFLILPVTILFAIFPGDVVLEVGL